MGLPSIIIGDLVFAAFNHIETENVDRQPLGGLWLKATNLL